MVRNFGDLSITDRNPESEPGDDFLHLPFLHVGILVADLGDLDPGLGEDALEIEAEGPDLASLIIEPLRAELFEVPPRHLPAPRFGPRLVPRGLGLDKIGGECPGRGVSPAVIPHLDGRDEDEREQGKARSRGEDDERPPLLPA
jgi:hypothetical protein